MFRFSLADHGSTFATRSRGQELRDALIESAGDHDEVIVELDRVLGVSYSFADEFVGRLADAARDGELSFSLRISGGTPETTRVIARALARRDFEPHELEVATR